MSFSSIVDSSVDSSAPGIYVAKVPDAGRRATPTPSSSAGAASGGWLKIQGTRTFTVAGEGGEGGDDEHDCAPASAPRKGLLVHRRVGLVPAGARGGQVGRRPVAARHLGLLDAGPGTSPFPFLPTPAPSRPRPDPLPPRHSRPVSRAPNSRSLPTCLFPGAGRRTWLASITALAPGPGAVVAARRRVVDGTMRGLII